MKLVLEVSKKEEELNQLDKTIDNLKKEIKQKQEKKKMKI